MKTHRLVDAPGAVSEALQCAWPEARPRICTALRDWMGPFDDSAAQAQQVR